MFGFGTVPAEPDPVVAEPMVTEPVVEKSMSSVEISHLDEGHSPPTEEAAFGVPRLDGAMEMYTEFTVKRTCCSFWCWWLMVIIMILIGVSAPPPIAMAAPGWYEWYIADDAAVINNDMLQNAHEQTDKGNLTERSEVAFYQLFMYKSRNKNKDVFTAANLKAMCEFEATLINYDNFQNYCLLTDGNCTTPAISIVTYFYGDNLTKANGNWDCTTLPDDRVSSIASDLVDYMDSESGQLNYGFFMAGNTVKKGYSAWTRSGIPLGGPLAGYDAMYNLGDEQSYKYENFIGNWMKNVVWKKYDLDDNIAAGSPALNQRINTDDLDMITYSYAMENWDAFRIFAFDLSVVFLAIFVVFIWMMIHIRSGFLAVVGILQIVLSLPAALFFYSAIFQIKFFGTLQVLTLFVILGIGADDVFVLVDAWKQSAVDVPTQADQNATLKARLKYAYVRCAQAVFNTSFTTMVAFFCTAISPIMPVWTFGVYSALCVLVNYIWILTLTPAALIIHERFLPWDRCECDDRAPTEKKVSGAVTGYKKLIQNKACAGTLWVLLTVWMALASVLASGLEPPSDQEKWMPDRHMASRAVDRNDDYLSLADDSYAKLYIVWGMKDLNRKNYNEFYPNDNRGKVVWDANFDLFNVDTQAVIYDACSSLPNWKCTAKKCDFDLLVRPNTTVCFLTAFDSWVKSTYGVDTSAICPSGGTCREDNRTAYFQYLLEFRNNEYPLDDSTKSYEYLIGFVDGDVKYVKIESLMTMPMISPQRIKAPIWNRANKFVKSLDNPSSAKYVFQWTVDWNWSASEEGFLTGLTQGMAIALPASFIVLMLATRNYMVSFFAVIAVGGVISSTLGICKLQGWELGIGESIAGVMVIGLAVDYTIHLGHMYEHSGHIGKNSRQDRFEYAADKMVGTVLGASITTLGAGLVMFICVTTFFGKMATLIACTIFFSLILSLFWFMPLLYYFGPEADMGRIVLPFEKTALSTNDKTAAA